MNVQFFQHHSKSITHYITIAILEALPVLVHRVVISPILLFFLKIIFTILGSVSFHINFRIILTYVYKNPYLDFDRSCIKLMGQFGENWHLYYMLNILIHECGLSLVRSLNSSISILWFLACKSYICFVKCIIFLRAFVNSIVFIILISTCSLYRDVIDFCILLSCWTMRFLDSLDFFSVDNHVIYKYKQLYSFLFNLNAFISFFPLLQWQELPVLCSRRMALVYILALFRS